MFVDAVVPSQEMGAYEYLWANKIGSLSKISQYLENENADRLSQVVDPEVAVELFKKALEIFHKAGITNFGTRIKGTMDYPKALLDDKNPTPFIYFKGYWDLVFAPMKVAVVGTRKPSEMGIKRARAVSKWLVKNGAVVVSGLAKGIDTIAHTTAIDLGGHTIAVIGTPLHMTYPAENAPLQVKIAEEHLLISHVPIVRHTNQTNPHFNRQFFPERNRIMSAISDATIIVEAGPTSGTRTQARAAIQQNRKLLIMSNVVQENDWAQKLLKKGAVEISNINCLGDALRGMGPTTEI